MEGVPGEVSWRWKLLRFAAGAGVAGGLPSMIGLISWGLMKVAGPWAAMGVPKL